MSYAAGAAFEKDRPRASVIIRGLGANWNGRLRHAMVRCPAHADGSPSLHVTETRDGTVLLKCFAGCDQMAVLAALRQRGLWPDNAGPISHPSYPQQSVKKAEADQDEVEREARARKLWTSAKPSAGTLVETYLRSRGVKLNVPPTLRFAPTLAHPEARDRFPPALVAAIQDGAGRICAVQRIYLTPDGSGKAKLKPAKMTLGPMRDGAVRLGKPGRVLGVAEGVETAMSAAQIFHLSVWAVCGASRLGAASLPDCVDHVVIFGDAGAPGEAASTKAAEIYRDAGYKVDIEAPQSGDWNDVAQGKASL